MIPAHEHLPTAQKAPRLGELLDEITELLLTYIALPSPHIAMLMACWIANTHTFERFRYCPYLSIRSSAPQCGKSRLLRLIATLSCGKPHVLTLPSAAVLFRSASQVLILDEADKLGNADREANGALLAVLNSGFEQGGIVPRIKRDPNDSFSVEPFSVYGPKAIAGLETLADTLADRTLTITMQRSTLRMPRLSDHKLGPTFERLRQGLQEWASRRAHDIEATYEALPDETPELRGLDDRLQDITEPLLVLAQLADRERPEGPLVVPRLLAGIKDAALRRTVPAEERKLAALLQACAELLGPNDEAFIPSADLLQQTRSHEELQSCSSERALAALMGKLGLSPLSNGQRRGYRLSRAWVEEETARYGRRTASGCQPKPMTKAEPNSGLHLAHPAKRQERESVNGKNQLPERRSDTSDAFDTFTGHVKGRGRPQGLRYLGRCASSPSPSLCVNMSKEQSRSGV
ncbi:MAG: hypothetical protein OJF50_006278 [Nitrospira sp.]|jgi:putative DNA primase/helicase|nr:hypothetical protein [Nitrospira sp.]